MSKTTSLVNPTTFSPIAKNIPRRIQPANKIHIYRISKKQSFAQVTTTTTCKNNNAPLTNIVSSTQHRLVDQATSASTATEPTTPVKLSSIAIVEQIAAEYGSSVEETFSPPCSNNSKLEDSIPSSEHPFNNSAIASKPPPAVVVANTSKVATNETAPTQLPLPAPAVIAILPTIPPRSTTLDDEALIKSTTTHPNSAKSSPFTTSLVKTSTRVPTVIVMDSGSDDDDSAYEDALSSFLDSRKRSSTDTTLDEPSSSSRKKGKLTK